LVISLTPVGAHKTYYSLGVDRGNNDPQVIRFIRSPDNNEFIVRFKRIYEQAIVCSLVPPNAKFKNVNKISGTSKILHVKELHLRNYKFLCVMLEVEDQRVTDVIELTFYIDKSLTYTPSEDFDDLTDPLIKLIKNAWPLDNPGFILMNFSSIWRGYPHFHVSKSIATELPEGMYQYVIIAPKDWLPEMKEFVSWKEKKGIKVFSASLEWIKRTYKGKDLAWKIREFIKDTFNKWQIRYVLLVGGSKIIPSRHAVYISLNTSYSMATDFYYAALDGTWDENNNNIYGEETIFKWPRISGGKSTYSEADWFPELIVGRLPVDNVNELRVVIQKILQYERNPPIGDWMNRVVEILGGDWGVENLIVRDNFPQHMKRVRLIYGENLTSAEQVISELNNGASIVWIFAHGNELGYWLGTDAGYFRYLHASLLSNNKKLPIIFADSCFTADFEYGDRCIAVSMLKNPHGGAVAYIGSTWFGIPLETIRGWLFGTEIRMFGRYRPPIVGAFILGNAIFQGVFIRNAYYSSHSSLSLLGDPEMAIWTEKPKDLLLLVPQNASTNENITIKVVDLKTHEPLQGIIIRIIKNDFSWIELISNENGEVDLRAPAEPGNLSLTVYALHRNRPTVKKATVKIYRKVIVDKAYVTDRRCDVGTTQVVGFHVKWAHNGTDATGCNIYVNGTRYVTNQTGWITFKVFSNDVKKIKWMVSSIECGGSPTMFIQLAHPQIIWDEVHIDLISNRGRIDVSSEAPLQINAYYEYDHQPFKGEIKLNNALYQDEVGKYEYKVESIKDDLYGLTRFKANNISIIFDEVIITLEKMRDRVDVGSRAPIMIKAKYAYDNKPFNGQVILSQDLVQKSVGKYRYTVKKIIDQLYGLTKFESNSIEIIFDRVVVRLSSQFSRIQVGKKANITYKAYYEYDQSPFMGVISFNRELSSDQLGKTKITVKSIIDDKYGLTSFKSNELILIFDQIHCTKPLVEASSPFLISITINVRYEYDSTPVKGAVVTLGNKQFREINPGVYSITIFSITPLLDSNIMINVPGFEKITINVSSVLFGNVVLYIMVSLLAVITVLLLKRRKVIV